MMSSLPGRASGHRGIERFLPCLIWARDYRGATFISDGSAALIVTVMLIPQSLAYAILAGLPPETGLYASILPLVAYTLFGTSRTLSVGPVALTALMTAAVIQDLGVSSPEQAQQAALLLAFLSGLFLLAFGLLRFGFLANFLSHPVIAGFITASGLLIALGQLQHILGIEASGDTLLELLPALLRGLGESQPLSLALGGGTLLILLLSRRYLEGLLRRLGLNRTLAGLAGRLLPALLVALSAAAVLLFDLGARGLLLVGSVPAQLPGLALPTFDAALWRELAGPALLISVIGYVESVSVGRTLGAKRRQKIDPDQELIGLGSANLAAGLSGGFPVTGSFSRSAVNFDSGAQTPLAGLLTAGGFVLAILLLSETMAILPRATLAATIIVPMLGLLHFGILKKTWRYSRSDFIAVSTTLAVTLLAGVELGVLCGVLASLGLHLFKTARPHIAEIGEVEGTEHFRSVARHPVKVHPGLLSLRVDESLYFANATFLEEEIFRHLAEKDSLRHVVLMCAAVNEIDISALQTLEEVNARLREQGIGFHLSEVKGPVMDALVRSDFLAQLNGRVFLSQHQAVQQLTRELAEQGGRASPVTLPQPASSTRTE